MKTKLEIECALAEEMQYQDKEPLEFEDWAHSQGWTKALEWVLGNFSTSNAFKSRNLCDGANNDTIKRAQERLKKEFGFGEPSSKIH